MNMEHILSLSYGKDSMACIEAIHLLGWPLDRIITADVWATDTIPAEYPPVTEFKKYADAEILKRWGIKVEHYRAPNTYESKFYQKIQPKTLERRKEKGTHRSKYLNLPDDKQIWGFPIVYGPWCNFHLKMAAVKIAQKACGSNYISYIGIAADEPERIERHGKKPNVRMPLVELGWTEADCRRWCEENGLLSPTYKTAARDGCWFCHNQSVDQLRKLRATYPDLWGMLMKWDVDSPITYKGDGHTVHDYDARFQMEDEGKVDPQKRWRWSYLTQEETK